MTLHKKRGFAALLAAALAVALLPGQAGVSPGQASAASSAVRWIDKPMIYYGKLTQDVIKIAKQHQLVVLHPQKANLTRKQVKEIQQGVNSKDPKDDVLVLGYISVGEDIRTYGLTDAQMKKDPRFTGDKTGPRVDPRGPQPDGGASLDHGKPAGDPSPGGKGFASWYLDDNDRDGSPDRNKNFNVRFVNMGDPAWYKVLTDMRIDSKDAAPGFREILTTNYGRGLGMDGVFLDTVDTAAPNSYTDARSANQSEFEWTAPGYLTMLKKLRAAYPNKLLLQNRGLFFFDSRLPHYAYNGGNELDFVLFESYRLNSSAAETFNKNFFADNKNSVAPKLMAEAGRKNGFQVLSLGYAEGPAKQIAAKTLTGKSTVGKQLLLDDIREAQDAAGFRHYLTNADLTLANTFAATNGGGEDRTSPAWSSTYNDSAVWPPGPVKPRVGIQRVSAGAAGTAVVSWDVALDRNPVRYTLYYQDKPFDFASDPDLKSARKLALQPDAPGEDYAQGVGSDVYPYQASVSGLTSGQTYYFVIRAKDASSPSNEEKNRVVLTAEIS